MTHPLVIVGAGPIGLAAAAHARSRGLTTIVLESGPAAGAAVAGWAHVRLFSPWSELVDAAAERLLDSTGWRRPEPSTYPTGRDWVDSYLRPLAAALDASPEVEVRCAHTVVGVTRAGRDRLVDSGRDESPFVVHVATPEGELRITASAVIDASGTWGRPNPLGGDGLPAIGERAHAARITYGIPDFGDPGVRARYAGRHVAVAGTGASAHNVLVGLDTLESVRVSWLLRRPRTDTAFGGGDDDQLEARGALGNRARRVVESGRVAVVPSFRTVEIAADRDTPGTLRLSGLGEEVVAGVEEIIVVTGFRPDLSWLGEVRLDLDPVLSAPSSLAPLIDPNVHSCGTVYPHGAAELVQPDRGLYLAGMKSYGRATSFLALTGFEQTRSIVAEIADDHDAAARVELALPDSGVCGGSGQFDGVPSEADGGGCCAPTPELATATAGTS